MTEKQLKDKINSLLKDDINKAMIPNLIQKAIASGCMDIENAEDNYRLPKFLLSAIYREMSRQYSPLHQTPKDKKELDNIYAHL